MKKQKNPNEIPEAHLEEDKESPGELTGEQVPDPSGHEGRERQAQPAKVRAVKTGAPKAR